MLHNIMHQLVDYAVATAKAHLLRLPWHEDARSTRLVRQSWGRSLRRAPVALE
jgi:hypothetical protein